MTIEQARDLLARIHRTNPQRYPVDDLNKALIFWPSPQGFNHVTTRIYDRERPVHLTFDAPIAWSLHYLALVPEPINLPPETAVQVADLRGQLATLLDAAQGVIQQLLQLLPRS